MSFGRTPVVTKPTMLSLGGPQLLSAVYYVWELARMVCRGLTSFLILLTQYITRHTSEPIIHPRPHMEPLPIWKPVRSSPIRLTVVLDLDETLVLSCPQHKMPLTLQKCASSGHLRNFAMTCDIGRGRLERLIVFLRPGLLDFLNKLTAFSEVVLFSAAVGSYGNPLLDWLDPSHRVFSRRLFRESTVRTDACRHVKDLTKLRCDLRRTVIVDNRARSFLLQPKNGIRCKPFRGCAQDRDLTTVILPLLEFLSQFNDVRPILDTTFQMEKWFRSKGLAA